MSSPKSSGLPDLQRLFEGGKYALEYAYTFKPGTLVYDVRKQAHRDAIQAGVTKQEAQRFAAMVAFFYMTKVRPAHEAEAKKSRGTKKPGVVQQNSKKRGQKPRADTAMEPFVTAKGKRITLNTAMEYANDIPAGVLLYDVRRSAYADAVAIGATPAQAKRFSEVVAWRYKTVVRPYWERVMRAQERGSSLDLSEVNPRRRQRRRG